MSRTYTPDRWVLLKINGKAHKVLAGWSGGYLDSDYWKLSSGVVKVEEEGDYYLIHNYSGSIYKCHKKGRGCNAISGAKYAEIKELCEKNKVEFEDVEDVKIGDYELS
tara:strand:- start:183 stop:506 length:324 start_codon:yes stop_codon:yes gene_type:complete